MLEASPVSHADSDIIRAILLYTKRNPEAADTATGIAKWWLRDKYPVSKVREALEQLTAEGFIIQITESNSRRVYKSRRRK